VKDQHKQIFLCFIKISKIRHLTHANALKAVSSIQFDVLALSLKCLTRTV